jgi:hypothetical protein
LCRSLLALENACFACPENEAHLAAVTITLAPVPGRAQQPSGRTGREVGLTEWLVRQVEQIGQQGLSGGFKKVGVLEDSARAGVELETGEGGPGAGRSGPVHALLRPAGGLQVGVPGVHPAAEACLLIVILALYCPWGILAHLPPCHSQQLKITKLSAC